MSVIGFDLAVETLLKVVFSTLDQRKMPPEKFHDLFDQCDMLLADQSLPLLPYRAQISHNHSIRNDAQHKAKYPNEMDISDCRTYTRDFCREVISNLWGISFDQLSLLEWIDDETLRKLLEISLSDIQAQNFKKALTLTREAFVWASESILNFLPKESDRLNSGQVPELGRKTVQYINAVLKSVENEGKYFSSLMSTGIDIVNYRRFKQATPLLTFSSSMSIQTPENVSVWVDVRWRGKEPNEETTLWVYDFVVNSLINWQTLGLTPNIQREDTQKKAEMLIKWDDTQIKIV